MEYKYSAWRVYLHLNFRTRHLDYFGQIGFLCICKISQSCRRHVIRSKSHPQSRRLSVSSGHLCSWRDKSDFLMPYNKNCFLYVTL